VAEIDPNIIASLGSSAGAAWILPLGVLNALPMILARAAPSTEGHRGVQGISDVSKTLVEFLFRTFVEAIFFGIF